MIERLFPEEHPFGGSAYSEMAAQLTVLRETLSQKLDSEGQVALEELCDGYLRQSNLAIKDAFAEGFSSAIILALELRERGQQRWGLTAPL